MNERLFYCILFSPKCLIGTQSLVLKKYANVCKKIKLNTKNGYINIPIIIFLLKENLFSNNKNKRLDNCKFIIDTKDIFIKLKSLYFNINKNIIIGSNA